MNIEILSMQNVQNFGSLLQSYALKKILESQGHTVTFLDIEEGIQIQNPKSQSPLIKYLKKIKKVDRYSCNRLHIKHTNKLQNQAFNEFRRTFLGPKPNENTLYDICIIGSDEVFNCLSFTPWGFSLQLFGDIENAKKIVTYAASCGATQVENLPLQMKQQIKRAFENISQFSVRDENTYNFVQEIRGTSEGIVFNFDPVLVYDFTEELKTIKLPSGLSKHYCVVYSYYNRISDKREIRNIQNFCKKHNLQIVTVGAPQMWVRNHLVLTPFETLKVFQNSDFVITDTFHGTIFSAKYANSFAVTTRDSNYNKLSDLLTRLDLEAHLCSAFDDLDKIYSLENNQIKVKEIIKLEESKTRKYLEEYVCYLGEED